jgi:hypothetical protein
MNDLPNVPVKLSLEGRAVLIADVAGRLYAKPEDRRAAIEAEALAHLRIVRAQAVAREAG